MAAPSIEASLDARDMQDFLDALAKRFESRADANKALANVGYSRLFRDVMDHFRAEEGPDGAWTAWSRAYYAHMERIGKAGNKMLQDTGRLRQSLAVALRQPQDGVLFINPAKTSKGFPYGAAHDEGGPRLPQRKFMWVSDDAMEDISQSFLTWMVEGSEE